MKTLPVRCPSAQWQPDGLTICANKWFLGAGFLGAPPISLTRGVGHLGRTGELATYCGSLFQRWNKDPQHVASSPFSLVYFNFESYIRNSLQALRFRLLYIIYVIVVYVFVLVDYSLYIIIYVCVYIYIYNVAFVEASNSYDFNPQVTGPASFANVHMDVLFLHSPGLASRRRGATVLPTHPWTSSMLVSILYVCALLADLPRAR